MEMTPRIGYVRLLVATGIFLLVLVMFTAGILLA